MVDVNDIVNEINQQGAILQPRTDQPGSSYFYARQIEAMVKQVIRTFSGFYYMTGVNYTGAPQLLQIPCKWGDASRMVADIFKNNSENTAISAPMFAVYIKSFSLAPEYRKAPVGESTLQVTERAIDYTTGRYTDQPGTSYQVDRLMSVPYVVRFQVDLYFSNASQQWQTLEQILLMFNPSIQIQFNENPLDWGATTDMELEDVIYNTRSYPAGTDVEQINVMSFTFAMKPFWLNPPAKIKKLIPIRTIIMDSGFDTPDAAGIITWNEGDFQESVTTVGNNKISFVGNEVVLLNKFGKSTDKDGNVFSWAELLKKMGHYDPETTIIRMRPGINIDYSNVDVIATFTLDPVEVNKIILNIDQDTIPQTTIPDVINFIDPRITFPGNGITMPPATGARYVITNEIIPDTISWGSFSAPVNSIISWNGTEWVVASTFDSLPIGTIVLNSTNNKLYASTSAGWVLAIEGTYNPGFWKIQFFEDYGKQGIQ